MKKLVLILITLITTTTAPAETSPGCVNYDSNTHVAYNSTITVIGTLRLNKMLENQEEALAQQFSEISMVLVSNEPLTVQGGEFNNPTACSVNEFTLYLSPENLEVAQQALSKGLTVRVTGRVGAAESSIEEYDNAVLRDVINISFR